MANKEDLDFTYSTIDKIFRISMGETGDFSGAKFDGDFSMSLEEAQKRKHRFIAESLGVKPGSRILDLGCGWGPFLNYLRGLGAIATGITLSSGQAAACQRNGLDVHIKDCRKILPADFGMFDGISSVGSFEHFCSLEEYKAGHQNRIYQDFFKKVSDLLPVGGRFYLQTMVFGKNMLPPESFDIDAPQNSDNYVLALMAKQFPGSWLPYGDQHIQELAAPYFKLVSKSSGRLDYIETINRWRKAFRKFDLPKYLLYASLIPRWILDKEFRHRVAVFRISPNKICFEREIMDHFRFVFEKVAK